MNAMNKTNEHIMTACLIVIFLLLTTTLVLLIHQIK
jgi:hypothetical protein